jgi:hypothetical protein
MKDSEIRQLDRSRRVRQFADALVPPLTHGSRAAELIAIVGDSSAQCTEQAARQDAAALDRQESTEQKEAAIKTLLRQMKPVSQTARAMDKQSPGIADQFRMPPDADEKILNRARAYISAATLIPEQFTSRGLPANFLEEMQAAIDAVMAADARQSAALAAQVAATASLADALKREREAMRELDPIMRNLLRDDPAQLAAWESASRIERAPRRTKTQTPPPSS